MIVAFSQHPEKRVLWAIEAALKRSRAEPFGRDYRNLVEQARRRILGE